MQRSAGIKSIFFIPLKNHAIKFCNQQAKMGENSKYIDNRTPAECRNGPIQQQTCTDCICCLLYLLLVGAVLFLVLFSGGNDNLTPEQIKNRLNDSSIGHPLLSIVEAFIPIIISLGFVVAICLIVVMTSYLIPAFATYIYIPIFLFLMLFVGVLFILRFFGINLPLISSQVQKSYAAKGDIVTLLIGIAFLIGFLGAIITIFTKKSKFKNIVPVLKIAKAAFWPNAYLLFFSFLFSIASLVILTVNYLLLDVSQATRDYLIDPKITGILIVIELLWTHGMMEAASDFFFESIAIHWYFKRRRQQNNEEGCCTSLCLTFKMMIRHAGTIAFGHVLAYIPETFNTMLGRCERKCGCCYGALCFCHRFTFRHTTKYSYIQTILQSLSFCPANKQMFGLRKRTKSMLPQLYMMGNFYITLAKIFVVMCGVIICFELIAQFKPDIMDNGVNLIGPLLVVLFASLQLSNHFLDGTGLVGDTLVFMYTVDVQIEKKNYGQMEPYSCPDQINEIIRQHKAGNTYVYDH